MQNGKLTLLIHALKTEEYKSFGSFLQSSFFTKSEGVIRLWDLLLKLKKQSKLDQTKKEIIFKILFPKNKYSDVKLRNLFRKLTKVIEEFLIFREHQNRPTDREILLNKIYRRRNVFSLFEKSGNKISKELEEHPERGSHYFLENYQWRKQHYFHPNTEKNSTSVLQLQDAFQHLHHFYSIEKLHIEVELRNQERIYAQQYDENFFNTNIERFAAPTLLKKVSELISTQDFEIYKEVKTLFYERMDELNEGDRNVSYTALLNFLITKSRIDPKIYNPEIFTLYKSGIEKEILFSDNKISGITFSNIVTLASQLSYFDWADNFIKIYADNISDKNKSDFTTIALSQLQFHQKKYTQTLATLLNYNFENYRFNYNAKILTIKTYYEQFLADVTYGELVESSILSFEKYIQRDQRLSSNQKQHYRNFTFILLNIYKNNKLDKKKKESLKKIKTLDNVSNKIWLQEKIRGKA